MREFKQVNKNKKEDINEEDLKKQKELSKIIGS